MTPEVETLLRLADEKLRAARVLLAADAAGDAASRAYYAAFHAVSAALLSLGQTYSSHGQVLGAFNRHFVHSGRVPRHFTTVLTRLYEDRQTGDYEIATSLALDDGRQDVDDATTVVTAIRKLLTTDPS